MKKISFYVTLMIASSLLFSCGNKLYKGFKKSDNGLYYKILTENKTGKKPELGNILFLTVSCHSNNDSINNSMFFKKFEDREMTDILSQSYYDNDLQEAYAMMREGEEMEFILKADSFFMIGLGPNPLPDFFNAEDVLYVKLKMNKIATIEELTEAESAEIAQYVAANNITIEPTEEGLYIEEIEEGIGNLPTFGDTVFLHITLKKLDGTILNSSIENGEPIPFIYGEQKLLPALDQSIAKMKKGTKLRVISPDKMAYQGQFPSIPLCTPLIFELEMIDIKK